MSKKLIVELLLLLTIFVWGINVPIMKVGLMHLSPMAYNAVRLIVAMIIVWPVFAVSSAYRPMAKEDIRGVLLISLGFYVFQLFFAAGLPKTTAGNASLVLALMPISVAIINRVFNIEKLALQVAAGIVVSVIGVVLIVLGSGKEMSTTLSHMEGALLLLAGLAGNGYYTVFSKGLLQRYSTYQITTYVITISAVLFGIISLPELLALNLKTIPIDAWLSVFYSSAFALCLGNFIWVWAVSKLGSTKCALYNNLSPIFAIIAGCAFLGESFGLLQLAGGIIIFGGLALARGSKDDNSLVKELVQNGQSSSG